MVIYLINTLTEKNTYNWDDLEKSKMCNLPDQQQSIFKVLYFIDSIKPSSKNLTIILCTAKKNKMAN